MKDDLEEARTKLEVLARMTGSNEDWFKLPAVEVYEALTRMLGYREKYCHNCHTGWLPGSEYCILGFWPVTADGKPCPYFNQPLYHHPSEDKW